MYAWNSFRVWTYTRIKLYKYPVNKSFRLYCCHQTWLNLILKLLLLYTSVIDTLNNGCTVVRCPKGALGGKHFLWWQFTSKGLASEEKTGSVKDRCRRDLSWMKGLQDERTAWWQNKVCPKSWFFIFKDAESSWPGVQKVVAWAGGENLTIYRSIAWFS